MMEAEDACRHLWTNEDKYGVRTCYMCGAEVGSKNEEEDDPGQVEPEDDLEKEMFFSNYRQ